MSFRYELGSINEWDDNSRVQILKGNEIETFNVTLEDSSIDKMEQNSKLVVNDSLLFLRTEKAEPETPKQYAVKSRSSRIKNRKLQSKQTLPKEVASTNNHVCQMELKLDSLPDPTPTTTSGPTYQEHKTEEYCGSRVQDCISTGAEHKSDFKENFTNHVPQDNSSLTSINKDWLKWKGRMEILDALSEDEKSKFIILEDAVAKEGLSYQPIDIAQFLLVSHCNIPECMSRMKKWRGVMKEWEGDKVLLRSGLAYISENNDIWSIGGYDREGRRVWAVNFGNVPTKAVLEDFPRFCKCSNLLWDALTVNVSEVRAGLALICDFRGFGSANFSLKLFVRFIQMIAEKYPLRARRIYLIDPPVYFWIISKFVVMFLPKKFQERLQYVSNEDLMKIIPRASLPPTLGGVFKEATDAASWTVKRLKQRHGDSWANRYRA